MSQTPVRAAPPVWRHGLEPGARVVGLGAAVALVVVVVNVWLVGELSLFFDLCFVALCLTLAVVVRADAFFTVGVLPPLMMVGVFVLLALVSPGVIAESGDGVVQAVISGLAHHAGALLVGYAVCLGTLAVRRRSLP